jgi:hypothetical protein
MILTAIEESNIDDLRITMLMLGRLDKEDGPTNRCRRSGAADPKNCATTGKIPVLYRRTLRTLEGSVLIGHTPT